MTGVEDIMIGAFWGPRAQDRRASATQLVDLVQRLGSLGEPFERLWFGRDSPREPRRQFVADVDEVAEALTGSETRRDTDDRGMPELGLVVSLDQGRNRLDQARITVCCGSRSPFLWNSVTVDPPPELPTGHDGVVWLRLLLSILVEVTDPDWARIDSLQAARERPAGQRAGPNGAWMLYLDRPVEALPHLPTGARISKLGDGALIETTDEWFDYENRAHRELAEKIARRLRDAGVLSRPDGTPVTTADSRGPETRRLS